MAAASRRCLLPNPHTKRNTLIGVESSESSSRIWWRKFPQSSIDVIFVTFTEPRSHWSDWNFKMMSPFSRIRNTPQPFMFWQGYLTPNMVINLVFETYTKFPSIWNIEPCFWTGKREQERCLSNTNRNWRRAHNRWGEFIIVYSF